MREVMDWWGVWLGCGVLRRSWVCSKPTSPCDLGPLSPRLASDAGARHFAIASFGAEAHPVAQWVGRSDHFQLPSALL